MKHTPNNFKGFTLLEILIVIVILAVLAGLAIPIYTASVEKARAQEAIQGLEVVRGSMMRFLATNNTFLGATLRAPLVAGAVTDIDSDPNNPPGGQNRFFTYTISAQGANTFTLTATRIAGTLNLIAVPAGGPHTITLNEAGTVVRSAIYQ